MIRHRAVLNAVRDAIFVADIETGILVDANPAAEALCGRSLAELRSLHHTQLHPPEAAERARDVFDQDTRVPGLTEAHVLHKDGHRIPVEISASHFTASDGRQMLVGVFRDTTERNQAREAVRRSEERFRQVAESAGEFIWEMDANGLYLYASPVVKKILGFTPDEVVGRMHFYDLFAPETREETKTAAFEVFARREKLRDFPNLKLTKDGRVMVLETSGSPIVDGNGNLLGYRGADTDVTERTRVEEALREDERRLASIYNTVGDIIFHLAVEPGQFRFVSVNPAFLKVTGLSHEKVVGKTVNEVIPEPSLTKALGKYRQAVEENTVVHWEETSDYPTGRLTGDVSVAPVFDSTGTCTHLVGSVHDITERKRDETALKESEERFSLAQSAAQLVAWDWVLRTNLITICGKYAHLYARAPESTTITYEEWLSIIHPDDREQLQALIREALEQKHILDAEFRVILPDGTTHWLLAKGTVFLDDSGQPIRALGVCGDVTERRQVEEALRQSEWMLKTELDVARHLQGVATQLISTRGTEALYEQILSAAVAILHSDFASIQMFHPEHGTNGELRLLGHRGLSEDAAKRWEWVRLTTRTTCGEALRTGRRVVVPDVRNCDFMSGSDDLEGYLAGGIHAAQTTPLVSRSGVLLGMVSTHWREPHELSATEQRALDILARLAADLIERTRAEEKLQESEERFRTMADTAPVMIWMAGPDKLWTFVNKACLDFTGHTLEHKLGYGWVEDIHPDDREQLLAKYHSAFDAREEFQLEIRARRANGEYLWMLTTGTPRVAPGGGFAGYIGSCVDLTEVKRTQEEALARQKLESVGTLASGIAHDFNNLLGGVLVQAEVALADLAAGSHPEEELQCIRTMAMHGAEIVQQLMIYAGEKSENLGLIDVSQIIKQMVDLLKVSVSKHATLEIDLASDLPAVQANAAQLRQIVINLVTNASEAIRDRDGVIRVATGQVAIDESAAVSNGVSEGVYVQLEVSDTGSGMSPETRARVFDPFFTTKSAGRGLGLAVVQGSVRNLRGAIHVASEPGKGTTFQILLPSKAGAEATADPIRRAGEGAQPSRKATVLIVEDEDLLRQGVAKMLRKIGFEVLEAANGSTAIDLLLANSDKVDAILLDLTLPGRTSRDVLDEAAQVRPDLKVILTSAYSEEMAMSTMSSPLIRDFIRKPFKLEDLLQTFLSVLEAPVSGSMHRQSGAT